MEKAKRSPKKALATVATILLVLACCLLLAPLTLHATDGVLSPEAQYNKTHDDFWYGQLYRLDIELKDGAALKLDGHGLDYIPAYILTALQENKSTMSITWDTYSFYIDGNNLGKLSPDLNYRFVDLHAMGLAKNA